MYARPFGVSFLFAGFDDEVDGLDSHATVTEPDQDRTGACFNTEKKMRLYLLSPSGTEDSVDAVAIGAGAESATKEILGSYSSDMSIEDATALALRVMKNVSADQMVPENVEIAVITKEKGVKVLGDDEIHDIIKKANEKN